MKTSKPKWRRWCQIFGIPRDQALVETFNCTFNQSAVPKHGQLYVFEGYICFYSNLFGKEVKLVVKNTNVQVLRRVKRFIGQRIMIKTADEELLFGGFNKCTLAFNCLSQVCNVSMSSSSSSCGNIVQAQAMSSRSATGILRSTSAPFAKKLFSEKEYQKGHTTVTLQSNTAEEDKLNRSHSRSGEDVIDSYIANGTDKKETKTDSLSDTSEQELFAGLDSEQTFPDYVDMNFNESQIRSPKEHEDLTFVKLCTIDLPINTVEFFTMCFAEDADYSLAVFQNKVIGDTAIEYGKWCQANRTLGQPLTFRRDATFHIKIKDPPRFCAKDTDVIERQRFCFFGPHCVVIDRVSQTPKVFSGDTFKVIQKWEVLDNGNGAGCQIKIYLSIRWLKTNWFKQVIQTRMTNDTNDWCKRWENWLRAILDGRDPNLIVEDIKDDENKLSLIRPVSQSTIDYFHGKNLALSQGRTWSLKTMVGGVLILIQQTRHWFSTLLRGLAQNIESNFNVSQLTALVVGLLGFQTILLLICTYILCNSVVPYLAKSAELFEQLVSKNFSSCPTRTVCSATI